jgi:predicted NUDIX family NTP pyrophosphohydrolase
MASKKQSAGLLMYTGNIDSLKVLIGHPGGPIFVNKDDGYWSIPKGQFEADESPFDAAIREFWEETGMKPEADEFIPLGSIIQKGGKKVYAWAFRGEWEDGRLPQSNVCALEWPPHTGKFVDVPEIDKVQMVDFSTAERKMKAEQLTFVTRLMSHLSDQQKLDLKSVDQ